MTWNPLRLYRRRQRLKREALDEAHFLRRRHGAEALQAARERLKRPDLTSWGHRVIEEAIKILKSQ
ncbi:MAG: hypothetical protein KGO51_11155 [Alphaproteobacteria bacterium]|nr:hypothetical protein [Alphaproteobacteria bacterium]